MSIEDKLVNIFDIIKDISNDDVGISAILMEGFEISLNVINEIGKTGHRENIDLSEYLQFISNVLGVSLEDMVKRMLENQQNTVNDGKVADEETLDFITGDLDDYEKFLAKNKAKEDLDFLSKTL